MSIQRSFSKFYYARWLFFIPNFTCFWCWPVLSGGVKPDAMLDVADNNVYKATVETLYSYEPSSSEGGWLQPPLIFNFSGQQKIAKRLYVIYTNIMHLFTNMHQNLGVSYG